jgi:hypothetical protein
MGYFIKIIMIKNITLVLILMIIFSSSVYGADIAKDLTVEHISFTIDNDILYLKEINALIKNPGSEDIAATELDYKFSIPELNFEYKFHNNAFRRFGQFFLRLIGMHKTPLKAGDSKIINYGDPYHPAGLVLDLKKEYTFIVEVDPDNIIEEIDETNNVLQKKVVFGVGDPDLIVKDITVTNQNGNIALNTTIANEGDKDAENIVYSFSLLDLSIKDQTPIVFSINKAGFNLEPGEVISDIIELKLADISVDDGTYNLVISIKPVEGFIKYGMLIRQQEEDVEKGILTVDNPPPFFADNNPYNNNLGKEFVLQNGLVELRQDPLEIIRQESMHKIRNALKEGNEKKARKIEKDIEKKFLEYVESLD